MYIINNKYIYIIHIYNFITIKKKTKIGFDK